MKRQTIKISQHQIQNFLNCRENFYLSEMLCLEPRIRRKQLDLGSAFHKGVNFYKRGFSTEECLAEADKYFEDLAPETQEEQNQILIGRQMVFAMLNGYFNKYQVMPKIISVEKPMSVVIEGKFSNGKKYDLRLIGTPDDVETDNKGYWIGEEKTTTRLEEDYVTRLPLDFQITFYFMLTQKYYHRKFLGVNYRITRVSSLQLKKKQTLEQYLLELSNDYVERPAWYYINEKLYRSQDDIKQFESHLLMQMSDLVDCYRYGHWYPNTSRCTGIGCWYIKYCSNRTQESMQTFLKKKEGEQFSKCFSVMNPTLKVIK